MQAIIDWPSPRNIFEGRSFHGLGSFYRKLIRKFNGICASIFETIKKDRQPFQWTIDAENCFQFSKRKITEQLVLKLPDFNHPSQVKCDARGVAIRAVLSQEDMPVPYFSETMNDAK